MTTKKLTVSVNDKQAGTLTAPNVDANYWFTYEAEAGNSDEVSLAMPREQKSYPWKDIHPVFGQNLPEGYLGDVLRKYVSKLYDSSDMTLLAVLGRNQIGRLQFDAVGVKPPKTEDNAFTVKEILTSKDPELFQEIFERYYLSSGVAGVQPKVMLQAPLDNHVALKAPGVIVKGWGSDFPELAANEYFCLSVARATGLNVPQFDISDDGTMFVMQRFDQRDDGTYRGFEDGCTLFNLDAAEKYSLTYEKLATRIGSFVSPEHKSESLMQLFISLAVSWGVQNGDAHLKNFGVLYEDTYGAVKLSPAFDIVSTTAYIRSDVPALTLGGTKKWWKLQMLEKYGQTHCGMKPAQTRAVLQRLGVALVDQAQAIENYVQKRPAFNEVGQVIVETFNRSADVIRSHLELRGKSRPG